MIELISDFVQKNVGMVTGWILTDSSVGEMLDGLLITFDKPIDKPADPIWSLNIIPYFSYSYDLNFVKQSF